jgi:PIN domain nuclease of toxin-antitoxin system
VGHSAKQASTQSLAALGIATRAALLEIHADPADRLIVATALEHQLCLVTRDEGLLSLAHVVAVLEA